MNQPPEKPSRRGSETRQRKHLVMVRLDDAERAQLEKKASGLSLAGYLRASGLGSEGPRARRSPSVNRELLAHTNAALNRVGNNLNQIAKAINTGKDVTPSRLDPAREELLAVLALTRKALGYDRQG